eukprot:scaffold1786_cov398-Prasinococcus_capsulatus_cf.AAC.1
MSAFVACITRTCPYVGKPHRLRASYCRTLLRTSSGSAMSSAPRRGWPKLRLDATLGPGPIVFAPWTCASAPGSVDEANWTSSSPVPGSLVHLRRAAHPRSSAASEWNCRSATPLAEGAAAAFASRRSNASRRFAAAR